MISFVLNGDFMKQLSASLIYLEICYWGVDLNDALSGTIYDSLDELYFGLSPDRIGFLDQTFRRSGHYYVD